MKLTTKLLKKLIREAMNESSWDDDSRNWPDETDRRQARIARMAADEKEPYDGPSSSAYSSQPRKKHRPIRTYPEVKGGSMVFPPDVKHLLRKKFEKNDTGELELSWDTFPPQKRISLSLHTFEHIGHDMSSTYKSYEQLKNTIRWSKEWLTKLWTGLSSVEGYNSVVGPGALETQAQELGASPEELLEAYKKTFISKDVVGDPRNAIDQMPDEPTRYRDA